MIPLGPRQYTRSVLRSYLAEIRRLGLFDDVRAKASPQVAPLIDDPGRAPAWVGPEPIDEMLAVVGALRGREVAREIGYNLVKNHGFAKAMEPFIQLTVSILGGNPATLFARLPALTSVSTRGLEMKWVSTGPASGVVHVRSDERMPDLAFAAWEGVYLYVLETARVAGTVAPARCADDGRSCEVDVSWNGKPPS